MSGTIPPVCGAIAFTLAPRQERRPTDREDDRGDDNRSARHLLRPVRHRDRQGPASVVAAHARRSPALLQRPPRFLRAESFRRRRTRAHRLGHLPLRPRLDARDHQGQHRAPFRHDLDGGSARARRAPRSAVARVHAEEDECPRIEGARVLRAHARPTDRSRPVRLHLRPGRSDADAHDRDAPRDPRTRPRGDPRAARRGPADRRRWGRNADRGRLHERGHGSVRGLHRLARREPLRRPHDRDADRRVRRRARHAPAPHARRGPDLRDAARGRGQRDDHPAHRLDRESSSPSIPTSAARSSKTARCYRTRSRRSSATRRRLPYRPGG